MTIYLYTTMDHNIQTIQLQKIIDRLVVPEFNSLIIDEYRLGEGIKVEVKYDGTTKDYIDPYSTDEVAIPVFLIKIITYNPILSFNYFSDGYYVLYNMISNVVDYIDPSRKVVLYFNVVLRSDSGDRLMDRDHLRPYMSKYEPDYDLLKRVLERIKLRIKMHGRRGYIEKHPPFER